MFLHGQREDPGYEELPGTGLGTGAGYMDVKPAGPVAAVGAAGYMDVSPNADGGYTDIAPNPGPILAAPADFV